MQREKCNGRRNPHYSCWSYDATVAQVAVFVVLRQVYALQKARIVKQATLQSFRFKGTIAHGPVSERVSLWSVVRRNDEDGQEQPAFG